jgi:hypothetical protein
MEFKFTEKQIAYLSKFIKSASEVKNKLEINYKIEDFRIFIDAENSLYFSYRGTSAGELEGSISEIFYLKVENDGSSLLLNDPNKYKDGDLFARNTSLYNLFESFVNIPLQAFYQFIEQSQNNQQLNNMKRTLERKKVKGGKYEFFIADADGNYLSDYSEIDMQNDIDAMDLLIKIYADKGEDYKDNIKMHTLKLKYYTLKNLIVELD